MSSFSPILDVLIGLAGVYVAFSLLASWLQERVAVFLNLRSKGLVSGIYQLFNGNTSAFQEFVNDPMFQALLTSGKRALPPPVTAAGPGVVNTAVAGALEKLTTNPELTMKELAKIGPSYLSKEQFGAIFTSMISNHGADDVVKAAAALLQPAPPGGPEPAAGAGGAVQAAGASPAELAQQFAKDVKSAGDALGIGPQVNAILAQAGGDSEKFLAAIENWYDDHMDRVTGWYKRESQRNLVVIGLVIALFFNVDSIRLYSGLTCNSALRGAAAVAAATASKTGDAGTNATFVTEMLNAIPIGWNRWKPNGTPDAFTGWDDPIKCDPGTPAQQPPPQQQQPPNVYIYVLTKLLGLIITMFALSLGAPFWFDALSRLTNVRAAGNKPDTSRKKA